MIKKLLRIIKRRLFSLVIFDFFEKDVVLFGSAFGYSDNPKYLYEEMLINKVNCFWIAKNKAEFDELIIKNKPCVLWGTLKWFISVLRCKTAFYSHGIMDIAYSLPISTVKVNLWHGIPLKLSGYDCALDSKRLRRRNFFGLKTEYEIWDYFLISSDLTKQAMLSATKMDEKKFIYSTQPRCDYLLRNEFSNLDIVTYMPTYRNNNNLNHITEIINVWEQIYLLTQLKLCIKLHPLEARQLNLNSLKTKVWFVDSKELSSQNDATEVLSKTSILISDYSSAIFDFQLTNRPIFCFVPDLDEYKKNRDFYLDINDAFEGTYICKDINILKKELLTGAFSNSKVNGCVGFYSKKADAFVDFV